MIDHNISNRVTTNCIVSSSDPCLTTTKTHITNDHIMCIDPDAFAGNTNTIAGCSLSCNSYVWGTDYYRCFYFNDTSNIKYNYSCATLFTSPAKTSRAIII